MLTVEQALELILAPIAPLPVQAFPLLESQGRVLAEDIRADVDAPPFDNSAVDGYAVRSAETAGASAASPRVLECTGVVHAGHPPGAELRTGCCVRVMTGAPLPLGADAVVMQEDCSADGARIAISAEASGGDHVRRMAEDVRIGDLVLKSGALIGPAETAMLAAMGRGQVSCYRAPRVAIVSTGDEVVEIGQRPGPGQIRNSNAWALAALVVEAGAAVHSMNHLQDDLTETERALRACSGLDGSIPADVIVTSGGVSVGERDFVKPVLERIGTLELWRVQMKPGKPLAYGRAGSSLFFGLPGNPVSTVVTFELFVRPALWKMAGRTNLGRPRVPALLDVDAPHARGREEYVRASVSVRGGHFHAQPSGAQGSGALTSMLGANALLILPADRGDAKAGEGLDAILFGELETGSADRPGE